MITAVIIAKNEEANLARCLRSLHHVADEILVLDSGSTDRTVEIAKLNGAKVHQVEWQGYAKTKNAGNDLAQHDYILSIDADEEVSPDLEISILRERRRGLRGAYSISRHNFYGDKFIKTSGWYPDEKIRLFHRKEAKWVGDFVHETLQLEHSKVTKLDGPLNHYSIADLEHHRQTVLKYAELAADKIIASGKKGSYLKGTISVIATFLQKYIIQKGFLSGLEGWHIAIESARSKWLRHKIAIKKATS